MAFWVYENTIHHKTRIHLGTCAFCKDGRGLHGKGATNSGEWFGPVETLQQARGLARSRRQPDNRSCQECLPNDSCEHEGGPTPEPQDVTSSESSSCWDWDNEEQLQCSLNFRWSPVGRVALDAAGKLSFPAVPAVPGIYRFRVRMNKTSEANYVGESDNIKRRFGNYRNPGPSQATSIRINKFLRDGLRSGAEISVAIALEAWVQTSEGQARADLNRASIRRLFENLALAVEQVSEIESLNR